MKGYKFGLLFISHFSHSFLGEFQSKIFLNQVIRLFNFMAAPKRHFGKDFQTSSNIKVNLNTTIKK